MYKTCPYCRAHLDPGEKCDCGGVPEPEIEAAQITRRRPARHPNTPEQQLDAYVRTTYRRWLE